MADSNLDKFDFQLVDDPRKEIRQEYRELFSSKRGRKVLADILSNCEFGSIIHPDNLVKLMWHNAAIVILKECGMVGPGLMDQVVNALCRVYPQEEKDAPNI